MKKIFLCLFIGMTAQLYVVAVEPKICLNMIVKNETPVIKRCLGSVKSLIDYWVIVDTGSTDGTQAMIENYMKDIPGELHERPWVNFAHNRNEALELAKDKGDYILLIDADEELSFGSGFKLPRLSKDFYYIETSLGGTRYKRVQLINNHLDWKWTGVLHETVDSPNAKTVDTLNDVVNIARPEGDRSKDPQKYQKDAQILEAALKKDPNNTRYMFYLAQSYKDAGDLEKALKAYQKRIAMKGWDQEIYWSMLQIALLKEALNKDADEVINSYKEAYAYRPSRAEPLYYLALYHRKQNNYEAAFKAASQGLALKQSDDILFLEKWITDYGMLLEYSIAAYWTERYVESLLASNMMLSNTSLPAHVKECVEKNLVWVNGKIAEMTIKANESNSVVVEEDEKQSIDAHYMFYLAQSYQKTKDLQKALEHYEKCAETKSNETETYWSLLQAALLKETLGKPIEEVMESYQAAYDHSPGRAETLYRLSRYQRKLKKYQEAFSSATQGLVAQKPADTRLVEKWVYDYGTLLEYSLTAYWTEQYLPAHLASDLLLSNDSIPEALRKTIEKNNGHITEKLNALAEKNANEFTNVVYIPSPEFNEEDLIEEMSAFIPSEESISIEENVSVSENKTNPFEYFAKKANSLVSTMLESAVISTCPEDEIAMVDTTPKEMLYAANDAPRIEKATELPPQTIRPRRSFVQPNLAQPAPVVEVPNYCCGYEFPSCCCNVSSLVGRLYTIGNIGRTIGNVGSYQTFGAYLDNNFRHNLQPFIDVRAHDFGNNRWGSNCGLGVRYVNECEQTVYGINTFYDYRRTNDDFQQIGIGLELSGRHFDLIANYYLPVGKKSYINDSITYTYPGGYFATVDEERSAVRGGDIELGTSWNRWFCPRVFDTYVGIGAYRYNGSICPDSSFTGVRYTAETNYRDLFFVGFRGTYDPMFNNTFQAYIGLSIAFDECGFALCRRIERACFPNGITGRPVRRNPVIVESKSNCNWTTNF